MRDDEWQVRIPVQNPCTYSTIVINDYNVAARRRVENSRGFLKYTYVKYNPRPSPCTQSKQNYFSTLIR